jgi:hypothetical protein
MRIELNISYHNLLVFIILLCLAGCQTNDRITENKKKPGQVDSAVNDDQGKQPGDSGIKDIKIMVLTWDRANNDRNPEILSNLYAEEVDLYGIVYENKDAVKFKKDYFKEHSGYQQHLEKEIDIESQDNGNKIVHFSKTYSDDKTSRTVKARLVVQKFGNAWKIVEENDEDAIKKASKKSDIPMPEKEISSCDKAAEAIFLSSDKVQDLLIQKYVRYMIEYKPGDKGNPTKKYWFWVFASPPNAGKTETYGRFQVDPKTGQLYEYDVMYNNSRPIASNTSLAKYLKKYCRK